MEQREGNYPLISVVVPVYNTKPDRLLACVDSLQAQTSDAFEIILVDDGSQDAACVSLLDEMERGDGLLKVIREPHRGVSIARNTGVTKATGDYILFVDSDDRIPSRMLERGKKVIVDSCCDVVLGYVQYVNNSVHPLLLQNDSPRWVFYSGKDLLFYHLWGTSNRVRTKLSKGVELKIGPVARLVRRELARSISFPDGVKISEDTLWSIQLFLKTEHAAVVEDIWYWYYKGGQSASSGVHPTAAEDAKSCLKALNNLVVRSDEPLPACAVLARVLGEVSRVARTWYSWPECTLSQLECVREMNALIDSFARSYTRLSAAFAGGPILVIKYLMCRSGLIIPYWRIQRLMRNS